MGGSAYVSRPDEIEVCVNCEQYVEERTYQLGVLPTKAALSM